ncbi:MmgE/PrpD family protein [Synechococcus sp. CS-1328]|uniref:MmgE/PrpD family protein n=1 Tax=Synechococcus sp. CS-1328 TaxID=2847976 RepID=UPI00223AF602|nr:MmgE/PrpD family protein [Synechococcus sp. CS-1328]MCT0224792.1 MmgE/PrpD family protein [Synechococcus sp. CS-1328]
MPSLSDRANTLLDGLAQQLESGDAAAGRLQRCLRLVLIDTMAVAVAGLAEPPLLALQEQQQRLAPGPVHLPGMHRSLAAGAAAQLLAAAACYDELVEGYAPSHGRPGLHVVPVCLALGQALNRPLGEVLLALLQGYELGARFGEAYRVPAGEHVDGTWGTVAATVAASTLLQATAPQRGGALTAALAQMSRSLYRPVQEGAPSRLLHPGLAAARGIDLALAAAAGFLGPAGLDQDPVLTALWRQPPDLSGRPGCAIEAGYVKLLPGARHLHYAATAALRWRERRNAAAGRTDWSPRQSGAIRLRTYPEACTYCDNPRPRNRIQAQFSLRFAVAATLLWGELRPASFSQERLADPQLGALLERISVEAADDHPNRWAELIVREPDGQEEAELVKGLPGDPGLPIGEPERLAKARALLEPALGQQAAASLLRHWLEAPLQAPLLPNP